MHAVVGGVGSAASGGALVEQHRPMTLWIEVGSGTGRASGPRSTVQVHDRNPVATADLLVEQHVPIADVEVPDVERLGNRGRHTPSLLHPRRTRAWACDRRAAAETGRRPAGRFRAHGFVITPPVA